MVESGKEHDAGQLKDTLSMPKTKDEFLQRLTLTIALLKRKSNHFLPQVAKAVDVNLNKVYHHVQDKKLRQEGAEKLAEIDGAKIIHEFILFLEGRGIQEDSVEAKLLEDLLSVSWNYCDNSLTLCQQFGECGFLDKLVDYLKNLEDTYKKSSVGVIIIIIVQII